MTDRMLETDDRRLAISITGANGPPVVMVRGLGGQHLVWWQVRALLGDVLCVSFGRPKPNRDNPLPADEVESRTACWAADQLRRLLGTADVQPPYVLVGMWAGGWIADRFAAAWPDEVAGLVQLDPSSLSPLPEVTDDTALRVETSATAAADGAGISFCWNASRAELDATPPASLRRAVVISRTSRTPCFDGDERTWRPPVPSEIESAWLGCQAEWAHRLDATHVVTTRGGYYLFKNAPELVAFVVRQVVVAARRDADLVLDPRHLTLLDGIHLTR